MAIDTLKLNTHMREGWRRQISSVADIADEVRDGHIESLAAGDYDFWFTPSLQSFARQINPLATKIFYRVGTLTAGQAPLLSGIVLVTGRGPDGQLAGLDRDQMQALVESAYAPGLGMCQLDWRLARAVRRQRRGVRAEHERLNRLRPFAY